MYTLFWSYFDPRMECGDMPLEAATLEEAEREALALVKRERVRKDTLFNLSIYAGNARLSYWNTFAPEWVRS